MGMDAERNHQGARARTTAAAVALVVAGIAAGLALAPAAVQGDSVTETMADHERRIAVLENTTGAPTTTDLDASHFFACADPPDSWFPEYSMCSRTTNNIGAVGRWRVDYGPDTKEAMLCAVTGPNLRNAPNPWAADCTVLQEGSTHDIPPRHSILTARYAPGPDTTGLMLTLVPMP